MTKLNLLGPVEVIHDQQAKTLKASKPIYLLLYLATSSNWIERDRLSFLFWPETSERKSQQNLRRLIHRAKELPFSEKLEIEKTRLRWNVNSDLKTFKEAVANKNWTKAVQTYKGPFLDSINPKSEAGFEAWLEQERADLARVWRNALHKHIESLEQQENFSEATPLLHTLLKSEPLAEDILQRYLVSSHLSGESTSALEAFEDFRLLLKKELDLDPLEKTVELAKQVKHSSGPQLSTLKPQKVKRKQSIPLTVLRPPQLIGRDNEIAQIQI